MSIWVLWLAALPALAADPWGPLWTPREVKSGPERLHDGRPHASYETEHFVLLYPLSRAANERDRRFALQTAARLDNLYDWLAARLGVRPQTPIRAVLTEDEQGNSRVVPEESLLLTGERGGFPLVLGSFFHELVHLFNFSVPGAKQDFWSGELFAQYHDDRLLTHGQEHRGRYRRMLERNPRGLDWSWIAQLDQGYDRLPEDQRQKLMELGVSVYYFFEDEFGPEKTACFWKAHLDDTQRKSKEIWKRCFGKSERELRTAWLAYYGLP